MLTHRNIIKREDPHHTDLDTTDNKGRPVGALIQESFVEFVPAPVESTRGYRQKPGKYYAVYVQTTRNEDAFGPIQNTSYFYTEAKRAAYIDKRLKQMKARFSK